jgi:SAM-dependent methyltransferase
MDTLIKFDRRLDSVLCCPLCKGSLDSAGGYYSCADCNSRYVETATFGGRTYDFRIQRPAYLTPASASRWAKFQAVYEKVADDVSACDNLQGYLDEIESVRELYEGEFQLTGTVLDIGGYQGRLRHYLDEGKVDLYISADPYLESFRDAVKPNLRSAYPCLSVPCNFVPCHAEHLPFAANCFDWVHLRSVVDHLADPYLALKEACRVLKPGGQMLIGLSIMENLSAKKSSLMGRLRQKVKNAGILATIKALAGKLLSDDHNFRLTQVELVDLISTAGFQIEKERWQKPPYAHTLYISARKQSVAAGR